MFEQKLKEIMAQIKATTENKGAHNQLPGNTYYLQSGDVLCLPRTTGVHRFPYQAGGFTMWAMSNGVINAVDGILRVFYPIHLDHDSSVNFFVGLPNDDGTYFPISILGGGKQLFEPYNTKRYLVYTLSAAYYIADTDLATFAVRASVTKNKQMSFSFQTINKTDKPLKYTLNTYFEAFLKNGEYDDMWVKGTRQSFYLGEGKFILKRASGDFHAMLIDRKITNATVGETYHTASRPEYLICQNCNVGNAESLKLGKFEKQSFSTRNNTPVAAEIIHLETKAKKTSRIDYLFTLTNNKNVDLTKENIEINCEEIDSVILNREISDKTRLNNVKLSFKDWHNDTIHVNVLNNFVKTLQKQVDFCAMGDNYVEHMLGVRDVFQQLEQAIIWSPDEAREKMIRALGFIDPSGRPPRQFGLPQYEGHIPNMDLRPFIDQGNWILTTFYMYLAYTNDYSILNEECGYYEFIATKGNVVKPLDEKDSVLEHLIRITDYLVSKLDREDGTNCLRIMYGDWNDAIDGLGKTTDEGKEFGTGVSVMASLQLYRNLAEMADLLKKLNLTEKAEEYLKVRKELAEGLKKHAIEKDENGEIRLIHGWGDHKSYKVGSYCDVDGVSRVSFAPFAYWAISDLISETPELREVIIKNILSLDSVYGILTNWPKFTEGTPGIGRIANTIPGFAENACAYVHASMFSCAALFLSGDSENAWKQIEKSMVITHPAADKTTFVMPNSYCRNLDLCVDGGSQNDWYTGSGTVLYKNLYRFGFGIEPNLDGLTIQTAAYMPCKEATAQFIMKGHNLTLIYKNEGNSKREIFINGIKQQTVYDHIIKTEKLFIKNQDISDNMVITVTD